jgi:16S rRNA (cytosine967-C5)-methyltransferase
LKSKTPRAICLEILNRSEEAGRHPDALLSDSFKRYRHLTTLDRAFLTELTYGVLRWRGKLDWVIGRFSNLPFERIEPGIRQALRLALYQILFLSRTPASAAVNESAELAKKVRGKGGAAFVNAVLRSVLREKERIPYPDIDQDPALHLSALQSHPLWLVQRWIKEMGLEETRRILSFNNQIPLLTLRTNTLKIAREALIRRLEERGLQPVQSIFSKDGILLRDPPPVSELPFLREGLFIIQDEASQLVTSILSVQPGEEVLDACAAPGGKTTHMAQRMKNQGMILALDRTREKLARIEKLCRNLGISIVRSIRGDAGRALPIPEGKRFDRILADVPCSGFGTIRRNPDLKWRRTEEDVERLSGLQFSILANVSNYLKEGGVLVYSTCTVLHEENEDVVEKFLGEYPNFHLEPLGEILPERFHSFVKNGCFKTFPPGDDMDCFFVARLKKLTDRRN